MQSIVTLHTAGHGAGWRHEGGALESRITIDISKADATLAGLERKIPGAVMAGVKAGTLAMVRHVTRDKLLGQYLNRRTGTLIRSITASPRFTRTPQTILGEFGSNLDYARYHEEGFTGAIHVPAYNRIRSRALADAAKKFHRRKKFLTASQLRAVSPWIHVRAHARRVSYRARHFLRDTVSERTVEARRLVWRALYVLSRDGKTPTRADLRTGGA